MTSYPNPLTSPVFQERLLFLKKSESWSVEKMNQYQTVQLQRLVYQVGKFVPFYREFLQKNQLSWEDFTKPEDVKAFPLIDKTIIQNDYTQFIPDIMSPEILLHRTTGGSTGSPLTVYSDSDFYARDKANTEYYMNVFGMSIFRGRSIRLYGDMIDSDLIQQQRFWYEASNRKLIMSCYHINSETFNLYIQQIQDFNPDYIHTRPSAILPLSRLLLQKNIQLRTPNIRYIFCDGEYITDGQRQIIEQAFRCRVIVIYGHTEACTVGLPCLHSNKLHFMPQVGILEILDTAGREVTVPGSSGEMVVTGFNNLVFPLIRYCTKDIGTLGTQQCECSRPYRILRKVEGRIQDYVVDKKKNLTPLAPAVFNYNDMDWIGIHEFKVLQNQEGELLIQIVPEKNSHLDAKILKKKIEAIFGPNFSITINFVEYLEKTKIGKYRYLDQKLNIENYFS